MASQIASSNATVHAVGFNIGNAPPSSNKEPPFEHPIVLAQNRLCRISEHINACFEELHSCKSTSERYEIAYHQLRREYDTLAAENKSYDEWIKKYSEVYQRMQKCLQSTEDKNREHEAKIKDLEKDNREVKDELNTALAWVQALNKTPANPHSPIHPEVTKRQRLADGDEPVTQSEPEMKLRQSRTQPRLKLKIGS